MRKWKLSLPWLAICLSVAACSSSGEAPRQALSTLPSEQTTPVPDAPSYIQEPPPRESMLGKFDLGFTTMRTNLPGGRAPNNNSMRAFVWSLDAKAPTPVGMVLTAIDPANTGVRFVGWSPDATKAVLEARWEDPFNAKWEEEHQSKRQTQGWLVDNYIMNLKTQEFYNLTGVERVSYYNSTLFFWPNEPSRLGFHAFVGGVNQPFSMNLDGTGKTNLANTNAFTYGFNVSPDGKKIAYNADYGVFIADADGKNPVKVETGNQFNFMPQWAPDSEKLMFIVGGLPAEPQGIYLVNRDGSGLKKLADRGAYSGSILIFDVPDYHAGFSDIPAWGQDSRWIYYTAMAGENVELFRVSTEGKTERLTNSTAPGTLHYFPAVSSDNKWIAFGSKRNGRKNLYVMKTNGSGLRAVTDLPIGYAAGFPVWNTVPPKR